MGKFHPMSRAATLAARALSGGVSAGLWRRLGKELLKPYRPELHYMRGPGPKCREKNAGPPAAECSPDPAERRIAPLV